MGDRLAPSPTVPSIPRLPPTHREASDGVQLPCVKKRLNDGPGVGREDLLLGVGRILLEHPFGNADDPRRHSVVDRMVSNQVRLAIRVRTPHHVEDQPQLVPHIVQQPVEPTTVVQRGDRLDPLTGRAFAWPRHVGKNNIANKVRHQTIVAARTQPSIGERPEHLRAEVDAQLNGRGERGRITDGTCIFSRHLGDYDFRLSRSRAASP